MNDNVFYSTSAVCDRFNLSNDLLRLMVEFDLVSPYGNKPDGWFFNGKDLAQFELAAGYLHYFNLSPTAAVTAVELSNEIDDLKSAIK